MLGYWHLDQNKSFCCSFKYFHCQLAIMGCNSSQHHKEKMGKSYWPLPLLFCIAQTEKEKCNIKHFIFQPLMLIFRCKLTERTNKRMNTQTDYPLLSP